MGSTATDEMLKTLRQRLRIYKKKMRRIEKTEKLCAINPLNNDQKWLLESKSLVSTLIAEYELLLSAFLEKLDHHKPSTSQPPPPPTPRTTTRSEVSPQRETLLPNKDWYLYLQTTKALTRLNISKLSEGPKFELVYDFSIDNSLPLKGMQCFFLDSKFYMVGGEKDQYEDFEVGCEISGSITVRELLANFDVFAFDPSGPGGPSFRPCGRDTVHRLAAPKLCPVVATLEGNIYVLATKQYVGCKNNDLPSFEFFDSVDRKWKSLPDPFFYNRGNTDSFTRSFILSHYAWGHKLVICLYHGDSYIFDSNTKEWKDALEIYNKKENVPILSSVAEYDDFLIAKPHFSEQLVAYKLDANGYPFFYQKLDELQKIFHPHCRYCHSFISQFDDVGRFCFIASGPSTSDYVSHFWLSVAVFRMSILHLNHEIKLTALLETQQLYCFNYLSGFISPGVVSEFILCDDLNLHDLDADPSFTNSKFIKKYCYCNEYI